MRNSTGDWLGLVENSVRANVQYFIATGLLPAADYCTEKNDLGRGSASVLEDDGREATASGFDLDVAGDTELFV